LIYILDKLIDKDQQMQDPSKTNVSVLGSSADFQLFEIIWLKYHNLSELLVSEKAIKSYDDLREYFLNKNETMYYESLICFTSIESLKTIYQK
jgi:hypothetical protein